MATGARVGIYRPAAVDEKGKRVCDWDEDSTTLAVEAVRLVASTPTILAEAATFFAPFTG